MSNEFVMVPREWVETTVAAGAGEVMVLSDIATLAECLSQEHQGEPVAWLAKCKQSGLVEQAEPNEKASNPEHWTDAFPVYDSPKSARSQFDYDRGFAAGTAECETLRAKLAERDALLRELDDAWNSHDGKERFYKLMAKIEVLTASAEPSAPTEIDERGLCCHDENWEFKVHPKCMLCAGTGVVQKELFPERAGLPCDGIPF